MQDLKTVVLSNQEISPGYYRMKILAPSYSESSSPGQFVMLRVQRSLVPLLRRPFGIYQVVVASSVWYLPGWFCCC